MSFGLTRNSDRSSHLELVRGNTAGLYFSCFRVEYGSFDTFESFWEQSSRPTPTCPGFVVCIQASFGVVACFGPHPSLIPAAWSTGGGSWRCRSVDISRIAIACYCYTLI